MVALCVLAFVCTVLPVGPSTQFSIVIAIGAITCFFLPAIFGIIIACIAVGLFALDAFISRVKIDVDKQIPIQLARGVPAPYSITTTGLSRQKIQNALISTEIRQPGCADISLTNKQDKNDIAGMITAHRRGHYSLPPLATRIKGPMKLAVWHRPQKNQHEIKVFPDLPAAYRLVSSIQQGRYSTSGLKRKGPLGLGTNFESVRDYYPDDDVRNVNWSATSRMGKPMTNQYRVEQDRDVMILIDTGRLMTAPLPILYTKYDEFEYRNNEDDEISENHFVTRLDVALDAVCGMVSVADIMGDRSGVIAFDAKIRKHLKPRRAGSRAVIRTIYDVEPIPVDSDFESACQRIGKSKRSFVLILTDFLDEQSAKPLLRALRTIVKKHRVCVAGIIDPDVANILNTQQVTAEDTYKKIGASQMYRDAENVVDQIRRAGAEVIYCANNDLMLECVRAYLESKQRAAF